jgi:tetratricopeptide (TPR) repeat protein
MRFMRIWCALAMATPAAATAEWREASTDHFVIYSEESPQALERFAAKLEKADRAMRVMRNIGAPVPGKANRVAVFVLPSQSDASKLFGPGGKQVGGFYVPRATGSVAFTPRITQNGARAYDLDADTILIHEYAHHFMLQNYVAAFPSWLIEGFAEFNSTIAVEDDGSVGVGLPARHRARSLLAEEPLAFATLVDQSGQSMPAKRSRFYARSWLATHYLTFAPGRQGQLAAYLAALNSGKTSLDAARSAFGDFDRLDRELNTYIKSPRFNYTQLKADTVAIGPVAIRTLGPAESAMMETRIRLRRGLGREQAAALLPEARSAASVFVTDAAAQTILAETELVAGNLAEAVAAADRALAADPRGIDALIVKGRVTMIRAKGNKDAAPWREARKLLLAANAIDADDPEPLILFHRSFLEQGVPPTANASQALFRALALAPQDRYLRWDAARQHLINGDAAGARAALVPLAYDPHGGERARTAAAMIAKIDSLGAKAIDEWNVKPPVVAEEDD